MPKAAAVSTDRPDDLFDVFDPWTREPESPLVPPSSEPAATGGPDDDESRGDVSPPEVVITEPPAEPGRRRRRRTRRRVSPPIADRHPAGLMRDPAGFLRAEALPLLQAMGRRLEAAGHRSTTQDLLDLPTPALRFLLWPRPGPLAEAGERTLVTLELVLGEVEQGLLAARLWSGSRPMAPPVEHLGTVTTARLTPGWIEMQALAFVEKVLQRA